MKPLHPYLAAALLALLVVPKLFQTDSHIRQAKEGIESVKETLTTVDGLLSSQLSLLDSMEAQNVRLLAGLDSTKADNAEKIDAVGDALREHRNYLWEIRKNVGKIKAQFPDIE